MREMLKRFGEEGQIDVYKFAELFKELEVIKNKDMHGWNAKKK